jgi:hypothetical protein
MRSRAGSGAFTLWQNESGNGNTVVGYTAMYWSTTGWQNTAVGNQSLNQNRTGTWNTAIGQNSLIGNTTGSNNTGSGIDAGACSTTASNNTATGVLLNQAQQQQRKLDEQSREIAALERQLSDVVRMSERLLASLQILQANDPRVAMR